jgi:hypothetical protein
MTYHNNRKYFLSTTQMILHVIECEQGLNGMLGGFFLMDSILSKCIVSKLHYFSHVNACLPRFNDYPKFTRRQCALSVREK